jgi:hypothetical protein
MSHKSLTFEGAGGRYEVSVQQWAEMLLLLNNWGWRPEQVLTWYLATGVKVSDADSKNLPCERALYLFLDRAVEARLWCDGDA